MHPSPSPRIASLRFWPLALPGAPSTPPPLPNSAYNRFRSFLSEHPEHFPSPQPPSPAAARVFSLVHSNSRISSPLVLSVELDLSTTPVSAILHIALPTRSPPVGDLCRGSDLLRRLFWHVARAPQGPVDWQRDSCGFVACGGKCQSVQGEARRAFRLERVFKQCSDRGGSHAGRRTATVGVGGEDLVGKGATSARVMGNGDSPRKGDSPMKRPRVRSGLLMSLPGEVLHKIVTMLHPTDFAALSLSSAALREFLLHIVPGLKLRLFPHQLRALGSMMAKEVRGRPGRKMPLLHRLEVEGMPQLCVVVDLVEGAVLRLLEMPMTMPPLGGLFCDEPGLGKTITALSLVLKSLGQMPDPPSGVKARREVIEGREAWVYRAPLGSRYCPFGAEAGSEFSSRRALMLPDCEKQGRRTSARHVQAPDFLGLGKGVGSVPVLEGDENGVDVFLSKATLVVVPNVLTMHWTQQVEMHVELESLRKLVLRTVKDVPESVEELALDYDLVIASFEVVAHLNKAAREEAPLLMRVHFLRVIVDEGHTLSTSNLTQFSMSCDTLRAERRWVMTGTPAPSKHRSDVDHLHSLLKFIREASYGLDKRVWRMGIREPYAEYKEEALERLDGLLRNVMIRADKSVLAAKCHTKNVFLNFTKDSAESYNWLVSLIRRNMINCDWFSERHKQSLFNKKNVQMAQAIVRNLRFASCYSGTQDVVFTQNEVIETLDLLYDRCREAAKIGVDERFDDPVAEWPLLQITDITEESVLAKQADLRRRAALFEELTTSDCPHLRLTRQLKKAKAGRMFKTRIYSGLLHDIAESFLSRKCTCSRCYTVTTIPMVTPCGHMLCEECIVLDRFKCVAPHCEHPYKMAMGADGVLVPEDLIELQPSAYSEGWKSTWEETRSAKHEYLVKRIQNLPLNEEWRVNETSPQLTRPKVIVHSQFMEHLFSVAYRLKCSDLKNNYVELYKNIYDISDDAKQIKSTVAYAQHEIKKFSEDPDISILLMSTKQGSVGLDLSFVQYIFLLEPVWDASVELQIVSRAHRIGCRKNIYIERLVMRDSVESDLVQHLERFLTGESVDIGIPSKNDKDYSRLRTILRNLKYVTSEVEDKAAAQSSSVAPNISSTKRTREVEVIVKEPARSVRFRSC